MVVIPTIIFVTTNIVIFRKVHLSSRRTHPVSSVETIHSKRFQKPPLNRRDLRLLRHMIIMISIFVSGWSPLYILFSVHNQFSTNPTLSISLTILCETALLFDMIELYIYNRELRAYFRSFFFRLQ